MVNIPIVKPSQGVHLIKSQAGMFGGVGTSVGRRHSVIVQSVVEGGGDFDVVFETGCNVVVSDGDDELLPGPLLLRATRLSRGASRTVTKEAAMRENAKAGRPRRINVADRGWAFILPAVCVLERAMWLQAASPAGTVLVDLYKYVRRGAGQIWTVALTTKKDGWGGTALGKW